LFEQEFTNTCINNINNRQKCSLNLQKYVKATYTPTPDENQLQTAVANPAAKLVYQSIVGDDYSEETMN
jgi:hypothetical protein